MTTGGHAAEVHGRPWSPASALASEAPSLPEPLASVPVPVSPEPVSPVEASEPGPPEPSFLKLPQAATTSATAAAAAATRGHIIWEEYGVRRIEGPAYVEPGATE
jgi:hypothetical protein